MLEQHLSQQTGHTRETVCCALRVEGMHLYHILTLLELQCPDYDRHHNLCSLVQKLIWQRRREAAYHIFYEWCMIYPLTTYLYLD